MVTFVPLQEPPPLFVRGKRLCEISSRAGSGAAGLEMRAAGGVCLKEGGIIATSFTICPAEENGQENLGWGVWVTAC